MLVHISLITLAMCLFLCTCRVGITSIPEKISTPVLIIGLSNCPRISGTVLETELVSCCPGSIQNCNGNYTGSMLIDQVKSDCDRMSASGS